MARGAPRRPARAAALATLAWAIACGLAATAAADQAPTPLRDPDGSCAILPGSHFTQDVSAYPKHPNSDAIISVISEYNDLKGMHSDFAGHSGAVQYGIPFATVDTNPAKGQAFPAGPTDFYMYPAESDKTAGSPPGRYPFPKDAPVEGAYPGCGVNTCGGDRHILVVDNYTCILYEAWSCNDAPANLNTPWSCANGAAFNLSNPLLPQRPLGWTSGDAAGLPIYPGLVKLAEVKAGVINHAIRFTAKWIGSGYAYPAGHRVTGQSTKANSPWMGLRARLGAAYNCGALATPAARTICAAMKKHGVILADVGSSWFLSGEANPGWEAWMNSTTMAAFWSDMQSIKGKDMEVVVPPGDCLCTTDDCRTPQSQLMCPKPFLPSNPPPPANNTNNTGGGNGTVNPPPSNDTAAGPSARLPDGSCAVLPGSHFTQDVSAYPKHPNSDGIVLYISEGDPTMPLHADFAGHTGSGASRIDYGIPFVIVDSDPAKGQAFAPGPTDFNLYPDESDVTAGVPRGSGRYPFPRDAPVEGYYPGCSMTDCDTDRHVLAVDNFTCTLYEAWKCQPPAFPSAPWSCANGAAFNLSNPLLPQRPLGWTSGDAAGLPIYPGLVKLAEVKAGVINHAIRFTSRRVRDEYEYPAGHLVTGQGGNGPYRSWMGLRARLRASYDCNTLTTPEARVVCAALKKYGAILADVGRPWFLTGEANPEWESLLGSRLSALYADMDKMKGVDMEVVVPPDFCLCTIAACLTELGTPECLPPEVPGTPRPEPPKGFKLVVQTGLDVRNVNGSYSRYNGTIDAGISTMYYDEAWNNKLGSTFFWPQTENFRVTDAPASGSTKFRVLLQFRGLQNLMPSSAVVNQALLNLTFINWSPTNTYTLKVCVLTKQWVGTQSPNALIPKALSWQNTGVIVNGAPVPWSKEGAAGDCGPQTWTAPVPPGHETSGMMRAVVPLPASVITGWLANNGASNFGLLLWADSGDIDLRMSQFTSPTVPTSVRPLLDIVFEGGGWAGYPYMPPSPSPSPPPPDAGNTEPQPPAARNADGSCKVLEGSALQLDVSTLPLHSLSQNLINYINDGNPNRGLHADFGGSEDAGAGTILYGIPFNLVDSSPLKKQPFARGPTIFNMYPGESDLKAGIPWGSGRYPFPPNASVEGAYPGCGIGDCTGDRHVLAVDNYTCMLYEAWNCDGPHGQYDPWACANGAAFNLSNPNLPQRPFGWTSGDAAGLPIYPTLVKVDEIKAGKIDHAIRFTARLIHKAYAFPASHLVSGHGPSVDMPWMGLRARLRAGYDCGALKTAAAKVICTALKKYGLILADVGSSWFVTGEASDHWSEAIPDLDAFYADMGAIKGSDMQVVAPPGHCLCTIEECLNWDGTPECLPQPPLGTPVPPPPNGTRIVIRTGLPVTRLDGGVTASYNGTVDAVIDTQYIAAYNFMQGNTYYWPTTSDREVMEASMDGPFRVLLRFDGLDQYVAPWSSISQARLNLTFLNWEDHANVVQVCALKKPWVGLQPPQAYTGLGWKLTGAKDAQGGSIAWTQPGAWSDCDPSRTWDLPVPIGHQRSGMMAVSLQLPPALVLQWAADGGASNFGLLMRCQTGTVHLRPSQFPVYTQARPALELYITTGPAPLCAAGTGGLSCASCATGSYSQPANASAPRPPCVACPAGKTTAGAGSAAIAACTVTICAAGRGGSNCALCAVGAWSAGGTVTAPKRACSQCAAGMTTLAMGSKLAADCKACSPGFGRNGTGCSPCPVGKWSPGGSASLLLPNCTACAAGTTTPTNASTSAASCSVLIPCAAGTGSVNSGPCANCAQGSFSPGGNATNPRPPCTPCAAGLTTNGTKAPSAAFCTICRPGFGKDSSGACALCSVGSFSPGGTNAAPRPACTPCAGGNSTVGLGSTSAANCTVPSNQTCPAGTGGPSCIACPLGSFSLGGNATTKQPPCSPCPANATTAGNGTASAAGCALCKAGYGLVAGACAKCGSGASAQPANASVPQPPCICRPGFGGPGCSPCSIGSWSAGGDASTPAPSCTLCPGGQSTGGAASTSSAACITGRIVFQTGVPLTRLNGSVAVYNDTVDAAITTQYLADYNQFQGNTYFWPATTDMVIKEGSETFRPLMAFRRLHEFMPAAADVTKASLNLTFVNWAGVVTLQVCPLNRMWSGLPPAVNYVGLGWRRTGTFNSSGGPVEWTAPSAWSDCGPTVYNVTLPYDPSTGITRVSLPLPPALVEGWLANNGSANYGLIMRMPTGDPTLKFSQNKAQADRPLLDIWYT